MTTVEPVDGSWSGALRRYWTKTWPAERLLPERQPAYVRSAIYLFGALTVAGLILLIATGLVLTFEGSEWWHRSTAGHFVNSLHFWSVQLFFFSMAVHFWGNFFMGSWRGRRGMTWLTGMIAFLASIITAFTGYLSQTNFESQWIATQGKDAVNSTGFGALFNVLDASQMLMWHIALMPLAVGVIVGLHVLLVRRHGVVPPYGINAAGARVVGTEPSYEELT